MADGAADAQKHLDRSGEPLIPELASRGMRLRPPMGLLDFQDFTLQGLNFEAKYSNYWNSTGDKDGGFYLPRVQAEMANVTLKVKSLMLLLCRLLPTRR